MPNARALVRTRDGHWCQRCGCSIVDVPSSLHHRKLRSQGGQDTPDNMIRLCGTGTLGCHSVVHANPAVSRSQGLIVWRIRNPADVPVKTFNGWFLLTDDGGKIPLEEADVPAMFDLLDGVVS